MTARLPHMLRIDVPLTTVPSYLYVDEHDREADPWWNDLWIFLLRLAPAEPDWRHEPVQDLYVARPSLTQEQRVSLGEFLRAAPAHLAAKRRSLRRAAQLMPDQYPRLEVVYFARSSAANGPTSRG